MLIDIQANHVFYGDSRGTSYIKKGLKKFGAEVLLEEMARKFNKCMDTRYGIFSLAKRPDNMALWAKYADNHKGYCLEFSKLSTFSDVFEVQYTEKAPLNLSFQVDPSQAEFLFTKSEDWSNEEEARIISKPPGLQIFPKGALRGIIFGEHCSDENVNTIINWIQECKADIQVKRAKFNIAKQKIEFLTQLSC